MSPTRIGVAAALAVGFTVGTAWLSRLPVGFSGEDEAILRLSWRMAGFEVESCRTRSAEELEALPVHMRTAEECVGTVVPYLLRAEVDGRVVVEDTVRAPGARADRPISVLDDLPLGPGRYEVAVTFDAMLPEGVEVPDGGRTKLWWSGMLELAPRDVALVTLTAGGSALELRR